MTLKYKAFYLVKNGEVKSYACYAANVDETVWVDEITDTYYCLGEDIFSTPQEAISNRKIELNQELKHLTRLWNNLQEEMEKLSGIH